MVKMTLAAAALALMCSAPAFAQDMMCDDASMMKMDADIAAMTGDSMKDNQEMAMKEMMAAKEAMAASKMDECKAKMDAAMKAMQG